LLQTAACTPVQLAIPSALKGLPKEDQETWFLFESVLNTTQNTEKQLPSEGSGLLARRRTRCQKAAASALILLMFPVSIPTSAVRSQVFPCKEKTKPLVNPIIEKLFPNKTIGGLRCVFLLHNAARKIAKTAAR
jgi:hypothetical protein